MAALKNLFEDALTAEGVTGQLADVARSIYKQESGSGKNTKTSNAGAVGGMQIIPATFASVADKGWDINDPALNARAGIRYLRQLDKQSGGDPALTAAGYYGGPGGMEKARRGIAVSDPRNPNAPTTLEYGAQVAARLGKGPYSGTPSDTSPPSYLAQPDEQFTKAALQAAPAAVAQAPAMEAPVQVAQAAPVQQQVPAQVAPQGPDQWQQWLEQSNRSQEMPVQVADLNYGAQPQVPQIQIPNFMSAVNQGQNRPNFQMLKALKRWA